MCDAAPGSGLISQFRCCLAADQRPAFDGTPVAGLPVGVFGFQDEAGLDGEAKTNDLSRKSFSRELLKQNCEGHILGMLRLCARPASGTRGPLSKTDQKGPGQIETLLVINAHAADRKSQEPKAKSLNVASRGRIRLHLLEKKNEHA
jgi:hypothetical protein